jgi:hypothetical protein
LAARLGREPGVNFSYARFPAHRANELSQRLHLVGCGEEMDGAGTRTCRVEFVGVWHNPASPDGAVEVREHGSPPVWTSGLFIDPTVVDDAQCIC